MRNYSFFILKGDFINGEIDLELYTISIMRLNNAFEKLNNSKDMNEINTMFKQSFCDLDKLYKDIVNDLNQSETNLNEYYLFFQNGKQTFPQYIETLKSIKNEEIKDIIILLINVFTNLNKIAEAF